MASYFERYGAGEREAVWDELLAMGDRVRDEPIFSEALAVGRETMSRVRQNIERLIGRLDEIGYRFTHARSVSLRPRSKTNPFTKQPVANRTEFYREPMVFLPPSPDVGGQIAELERMAGPLPISLRAWYEIVGEVNLMGSHPAWPRAVDRSRVYPDPLVMLSAESALRDHDTWSKNREFGLIEGSSPFRVWTHDALTKAGLSGAGYYIRLPNPTADAPLEGERHNAYFIDYLRICFRWGGFPGFEFASKPPRHDLAYLAEGLIPI